MLLMLSVVICNYTFSFFGVSNSIFIRGRIDPTVHTDTRKVFLVVAGNFNYVLNNVIDNGIIRVCARGNVAS